ncbi:hypothetical protein BGZ83_010364 [Gryganskiella cystojenkinii]|nr:hypothetical protein BGZ83_010364 [Gryganskiella cystojenkinii]
MRQCLCPIQFVHGPTQEQLHPTIRPALLLTQPISVEILIIVVGYLTHFDSVRFTEKDMVWYDIDLLTRDQCTSFTQPTARNGGLRGLAHLSLAFEVQDQGPSPLPPEPRSDFDPSEVVSDTVIETTEQQHDDDEGVTADSAQHEIKIEDESLDKADALENEYTDLVP